MALVQSFTQNVQFDSTKVKAHVILETTFSKEIRIALVKNQLMKEHQAPFPIIIHVLTGSIILGIAQEKFNMMAGDIITLDANVPHDLFAQQDAIVRLSLSKHDKVERVEQVVSK